MTVASELVLRRRLGLMAVAVVVAGPASVVATYLWFHDEMPDRMPVWWALDQSVVATADTTIVSVGCVLVGLLAAVAALAGDRLGFFSQRLLLVGLAAASGLVSGLWWTDMGLVLNAGAFADPELIPAPGWELWWPVVWTVMLGLAALLTCGQPPTVTTDVPPDPDTPRVTLPDDEPVVWQCDLVAIGFGALAGMLCIAGASSYRANPAVATFCWVLALIALAFARTRIRIDESGVRLCPWGLPAPVIARYDTIVDARAESVRPLRWRGRGYRMLPGATGWIPRTRLGLVLSLADGRRLGIAMDQAEVAAGIVNSMLDRQRLAPLPAERPADAPAERDAFPGESDAEPQKRHAQRGRRPMGDGGESA